MGLPAKVVELAAWGLRFTIYDLRYDVGLRPPAPPSPHSHPYPALAQRLSRLILRGPKTKYYCECPEAGTDWNWARAFVLLCGWKISVRRAK